MAQGQFPIVRARQELGFTPSTAVRANIDVRQGDVGAAIGQALIQGTVIGLELFRRKQQMNDTLTKKEAKQIRDNAELEIEKFRAENADTRLWTPQAEGVIKRTVGAVKGLKASNEAMGIINLDTTGWASKVGAEFIRKEIEQKKSDTKGVIIDDVVEAFRNNDSELKTSALKSFDEQAKSIFSPDEARIVRRNAITAGFTGYFKDRAVANPTGTIELLKRELELRKSDKGKIPDFTRADYEEQERRNRARLPLLGPHKRPDGTLTGPGFLGRLKGKTGMVNAEISIGVEIDGKEMDIPTLVPTLTKKEINYLIDTPESEIMTKDKKLFDEHILPKAIAHAKKRISQGKSPFADDGKLGGNGKGKIPDEILTNEQLDDLIDFSRVEVEQQRRDRKATDLLATAQINETNKLVLDELNKDINNTKVFDGLPDEMRKYWGEKLLVRRAIIDADRGDPFLDRHDPSVYNSIRTILEQAPDKIDESSIIDRVGNGLTIGQGLDLVNRRRKLLRKDKPLTDPSFKRAKERIENAHKAGIIKHPGYIEGAEEGGEEEFKNSMIRDQLIDELEAWMNEKPRTPSDVMEYTTKVIEPYEEIEARSFLSQVFHNMLSREAYVFSARDYRNAIESLNKEAQDEWQYQGQGERRHKVFGGIMPEDFIHKWQSPHKILTPQMCRIYLKWAHGDETKAKAMTIKDGWKEP